MRIGYLECFAGISGDMLLGALVDAGVSRTLLEDAAKALDIGATLRFTTADRSGITATKVDVLDAASGDVAEHVHEHHEHGHSHEQDHSHDHSHEHKHEHHHEHGHDHDHGQRPAASARCGSGDAASVRPAQRP